jgi:hypothetical protein
MFYRPMEFGTIQLPRKIFEFRIRSGSQFFRIPLSLFCCTRRL